MVAAAALSAAFPADAELTTEGALRIGGCDALELARSVGTPAYVVAERDLRDRAERCTRALAAAHPGPGAVVFASKAFPCTAALRVFAQAGLWCDVASGGELHLALRAGFPAERILLHGNAKSGAELAGAVAAGVGLIVVDNAQDADRLEALGRPQAVLVRVTPGVSGATHAAVQTGQADSKFGVALAEAPALLARLRASEHLELRGLHLHIGSQIAALAPFAEAVAALAPLGAFAAYDLGGGLATPYLREDATPSIEDWVGAVVAAAHEHLDARTATLLLEPGRALVANAGVTLYTVETVKRNVSTWVAVDGGMSDNLRPMLYGSVYDAEVVGRFTTGPADGEVVHLAGKHCESGDVLVRGVRLRDPAPGDVVVVPATGAYNHALANNYNGVPRPPVVFCAGGEARVVVRRETYDDLVARDL